MPPSLRPTGLSRDPDARLVDLQRWRALYEDLQASRQENRWFWSITIMGPGRFRTDSRAATLDQAKADFQAAWAAFKAANAHN